MRPRGVFFDLYGTLLVYGDMTAAWSAWLQAMHIWLTGLGLGIDRDMLTARCEGFFSRPEPVSHNDGLTLYEERLAEFASDLGVRPGNSDLRRAAEATIGAWQRYVDLDPDAPPVLDQLVELGPLALISNFDHPPHVESVLRQTDLARHFEEIVVSGSVGVKKPDPRIFAPALDSLALAPERVAFVGDAPEDIQAAHAAGMIPIRISRVGDSELSRATDFRHAATPPDWEATHPCLEVASLRELPELLAELAE